MKSEAEFKREKNLHIKSVANRMLLFGLAPSHYCVKITCLIKYRKILQFSNQRIMRLWNCAYFLGLCDKMQNNFTHFLPLNMYNANTMLFSFLREEINIWVFLTVIRCSDKIKEICTTVLYLKILKFKVMFEI